MAVNPDVLPKGPVGYPWLSRIMTHGANMWETRTSKWGQSWKREAITRQARAYSLKLVSRSFKKEHDPDLIAEDYDEAVVRVEFVDEAGVVAFMSKQPLLRNPPRARSGRRMGG